MSNVLSLEDKHSIRQLLQEALEQAGLGALVQRTPSPGNRGNVDLAPRLE